MNLYKVSLKKDDTRSFFYVMANSVEEAGEETKRLNPDWQLFSPDPEIPEVEMIQVNVT